MSVGRENASACHYSAGKCMTAYLKSHKLLTGSVLTVVLLTAVAALIPPQVLKVIVDDILTGGQEEKLLQFALFYMGSYLLMGFMELIKEGLMVRISQGISTEIRISLLRHVNRLTYREFTRHDSGAMEAYFNNDVLAINRLITSGVISIVTDLFKMVGIVVTIFLFSVQFGLVILVLVPFLAWFSMYVRKHMFDAELKTRNLEGHVNHLVYENIENMEALQLYDKGISTNKYVNVLKEHFKASEKTVRYIAIFPVVMEIIKTVIIASLILLSGYSGGFLGLSVGGVVATITLVTDLFAPIENLGVELQNIQKSMAGLTRINQFFKLEEEPVKDGEFHVSADEVSVQGNKDTYTLDSNGTLEGAMSGIRLRFENVSFSYDGKEEVIKDFNFVMSGTDKITLKGRSGAGKSTIMKLAYGLLTPTAGRVVIETMASGQQVDVSSLTESSKRGLFGIVYQEPFFSGETIYEELALHHDISKEKVREALDIVGLRRITDIHKRFQPSDYSTGELSLLNIARVLLLDCKILFLDEMNARIDPVTAERIMGIMNRIAKDKMVLSISHYGSRLDGAKVVEIGEAVTNP